MKIGILTFHRAINFGAVLQCFALYETLRGMGHDVEVIDYRPSYIEKYRRLFYWKEFKRRSFLSKIKTLCDLPFSYYQKRKTSKIFDDFLNEHIRFSNVVKGAQDVPAYYDVIVFGSDQIWNPRICEGLDPVFWGQFDKGKREFVSYAASIGTPQNIKTEQWATISEYLRSFDELSVREVKLAEFIQRTGMDVEVVLDPTLLISPNMFERLAAMPSETNYVLLYMLEYDSKTISFAQDIARQKGLRLLRLQATTTSAKSHREYDTITPKSVYEFLGYFKYADYIVNASFHGTVFSFLFRKDFYTVRTNNYERACGFLNSVGLIDRFVDPINTINMVSIDYTNPCSKLEILRQQSVNYISEVTK